MDQRHTGSWVAANRRELQGHDEQHAAEDKHDKHQGSGLNPG
ncbi:hypothetical protein ACGFY9_05075 [Streptomyces sp. NPDC048504]